MEIEIEEKFETTKAMLSDKQNESTQSSVIRIPIEKIGMGIFNPRTKFSEEYIAELAESMNRNGQWNPILVHKDTMGCISGECRIKAAKILGWKEIDAKILDIPKMDAYRLALETNIKQKNLSIIEEATHVSKMMMTFEWSQRKTASELGKSEKWVRDRLRLLDLDPEIQDMIVRGILAPSHGIELARATDKELQLTIANRIVRDRISTGEPTECLIKESLTLADSAKNKEELAEIIKAVKQLTTTDMQQITKERKSGLHVDFPYRIRLIDEGAVSIPLPIELYPELIALAKKTGKDLNALMEEAVDDWIRKDLKKKEISG